MLSTVERAGLVLELFTTDEPLWGPTRVAQRVGISKSQAHEMLVTLTATGLLRSASHGQYELGWRLVSMARVVTSNAPFVHHSRTVLTELNHRLGETVVMGSLDRSRVVTLAWHPGKLNPSDGAGPSTTQSEEVTAVAKVLMSDLDSEALASALGTEHSSKLDKLESDLDLVRLTGLAYDNGEIEPLLRCVAAPVTDEHGRITAALAVSSTPKRWQRNSSMYARAVRDSAQRLSRIHRQAIQSRYSKDLSVTQS